MLVLLNRTRCSAFSQHGMNFIFCHGGIIVLAHPQQLEQAVGGGGQQNDKWLGDFGQQIDGLGHQAGNAFGVGLPQTLGHQLTNHNRYIGDQHDHNGSGQGAGVFERHPLFNHPHGQGLCQGCLTKNTVQHTNRGDTNLDGGEKTRGVFAELQRGSSSSIALIYQLLKPCPACCDQRDFGHGKYAVQDDEGDKYRNFHDGVERPFNVALLQTITVRDYWIKPKYRPSKIATPKRTR